MVKIKDAAAWKKTTKNGGTYLSVKINYEDGTFAWVNLFDNRYKDSEKKPDMKTLPPKPQEQVPEFNEPPFGIDPEEKLPF